MSISNFKLKLLEHNDLLSSGICDNCNCPEIINVGDGEPYNDELYCKIMNIFIEPKSDEDQIKKCKHFKLCE